MRSCWRALAVLIVMSLGDMHAQGIQEKLKYPILQVVKLTKPPTIDGRIEKDEWQEAAAITGFVSWGTRSVVPQFQDVVWYLGYDDRNIYMAMHSPHPEGTLPFARIKERDNGNVTFEDHVEIQISPHMDRDVIMQSGFYKLQVNARGALCDHHFYHEPGQDGIEWSSHAEVKCGIEKTYWDLELAMPIKSMRKVESLDNDSRVIQLVRADACNGVYYICWAVGDWLDWDKFAEVRFVPEGVVCRFLKAGALIDGNVDTQLEFVSRAPQQVTVTVQMDSPNETLYTKTESVNAEPGKVASVRFRQEGLKIADAGNTFRIRAVGKRDGKDVVLYAVDIPVAKLTEEFRKKYIEPWLAGRRPSGAYEFAFGYRPYYNSMDAGVDLDFMGVPEKFQRAPSFRLTVSDKSAGPDGKPIKQITVPIEKLRGYAQFPVPELPEGEYAVKMELLDKDGSVLDTKTGEFERIRFPWEHNKLGLSDVIVPPYTPLEVKGKEISPWGRTYTVGKTGFPEQIVVTGVPVLRAPIRLESRQAGTKHISKGEGARFVRTAKDRVDIEARGSIGAISTKIKAFLEYDGWYQVALTLEPKKEVEVESLDLLLDLWEGANTMAMNLSVTKGAIPNGMGVVWDNTQMPPGNDFVPVIYFGAPDRGIWWYQEWDRGWVRDPAKPSIQFERDQKGLLTFRIRLFNTSHILKEGRTIEFALLAQPAKPLPEGWRKVAWSLPGKDYYTHWGVGFRHWGYSEDGFDLHTEEDFDAHGEFLLYPDDSHITWADWGGCFAFPLRRNPPGTVPCALYGSHCLMGLSMPEFRVFGGEWRGSMALPTLPDGAIKDTYNYMRTSKRIDPEQTHCTWCNFTPSMIDCYVWYHRKLFEKGPAQGHDWDNNRINGVPHYNEQGLVDGWKFNLFGARQLHKRLNVMTWELGKRPFFVREHQFFPWAHAAWFTEGPFYIYQKGSDYIDTFPADQFRSQTCVYGGLIPNIRAGGDGLTPASFRSLLGLCLLHDIGVGSGPGDDRPRLLDILDKQVNFFDEKACRFLSYWDHGHIFRANSENVQVSAYQNGKRTLFVLLNSDGRQGGVAVNLAVRAEALGLQPKRLYDPWDEGKIEEIPRKDETTWGPIRLPRHDFRILVLE